MHHGAGQLQFVRVVTNWEAVHLEGDSGEWHDAVGHEERPQVGFDLFVTQVTPTDGEVRVVRPDVVALPGEGRLMHLSVERADPVLWYPPGSVKRRPPACLFDTQAAVHEVDGDHRTDRPGLRSRWSNDSAFQMRRNW